MGDDDKTPPRGHKKPRARSQWDDDRRANVGKKHRTAPHGIPVVTQDQIDELEQAVGVPEFAGEENTKPIELMSDEGAFLNERINRVNERIRRNRTKSSNEVLDALGKRPPNERITAIETRLKIIIAILAAIGSVAIGAAITVAKGLYERGQEDGALHVRVENLERGVAELQRELGMPDRYLRQVLPFPTQKGPQP